MTAKRVQVEIVDDGAVRKSIDRVAQSAANNQPKARGRQEGSGSKQPPREQTVHRQAQDKQRGLRRGGIAGEQAELDATVPSQS